MSITREELGLDISRAIRETDESAMHSLDEWTLSAQINLDVRELADKLMPLLALVWQEGVDAKSHEWRRAVVQACEQDWTPIPTPVNPYEKVNDV